MALPDGITPKVVTVGIASFFDGSLASGTASITAPVNVIHTPTNRPIFSSIITQPFVDGAASFILAPTDAPGLNRVDWTYKLNVNIAGALVQPDPIYFTLPAAGPDTIDLDSLVTVPSSAGTPVSVSAALLAGPNTFTGTQDFTGATVLGVSGAVSSVVGQSGAVTGTQIAADPALGAALLPYNPNVTGLVASPGSAIQTATTTILNGGRIDSFSGNRVGEKVITLPPGRFVVTDPGVFMQGTAADGRRSRGLVIQGSGRYSTEIVFAPTASAYLFDNQDRVSRITLRDITFTGNDANANFMNSLSNGGPQDLACYNVNWRGTWTYGFYLSGTDTNSEFNFFGCSVIGTWGTFLYNANDPQVLNHNFFGCNMEPDTGDVLNYQVGGHVNIYGGSWIGAKNNASGTGTLITLGQSSALGVNRLHMSGVRIEYRTGSYKLINSQWSTGIISFSDMQDVGYQSNAANEPTFTRAVFSTASAANAVWPTIIFDRCRLYGMHQYISLGQNDSFQQDITYRDCVIQNFSTMAGFIISTLDASVSTRIGAAPPIRFDGCRSGSNTSSTVVTDQTYNGHLVKNAPLRKYIRSMKNGFGTLPAAGDTALTLTIPLNAIVTSIRAFGRAGASVGTNTAWGYTIQTLEGTPTVLFSKGGADTGAGQSTGFNIEVTPWFIADSETKRQLTLSANSNTSGSGTAARILVEYPA